MARVITYFSLWDFARWFRLFAGILMLFGAICYWQFLPLVFGGFFLFQAFTNTGCCNAGSCEIPSSKQQHQITKDKN